MADTIVAWDTCVLIDAIQKTPDRWESIAPVLNLAIVGDLKLVISTVSIAECYYLRHAASEGLNQAEQNALIERWLEHSYLVKRAADFGTCKIAAEIGRITRGKLSPNDAIIAATAIRHSASALITYDNTDGQSLLAWDGKLSIGGSAALRICTPQGWTKDHSPYPQLFT